MTFVAYDLALEIVRALRQPIDIVKRHDSSLGKQLTNAITSVALNIAEGNDRAGGDRLHHFRIALGSLRESSACLDIAAAWGWLDAVPLAAERHRLGGLLYGLIRR